MSAVVWLGDRVENNLFIYLLVFFFRQRGE